ncbi:Dicarboxylate transport [Alteromonadaceae bacterium Bs31]|nr:Dicarboxylate transport [Alteromonadaceae bacterium Bs31]
MRKLFYSLLLLLVLFVLTPASLWFFSPHYAKPLAKHLLRDYGLDVKTLKLQRPQWKHIYINELEVTLSSGEKLLVKELAVNMGASIKQFDIAVSSVVADLSAQAHTEKDAFEPSISSYLPSALLNKLPQINAHIHNFECLQCSLTTLTAENLQVSLGEQTAAVTSKVTIAQDKISSSAYAKLTLQRDNSITLQASTTEKALPYIYLTANILQQGEIISANSRLKLDELSQLETLIEAQYGPEFRDIEGQLSAEISATLPDIPLSKLMAEGGVSIEGLIQLLLTQQSKGLTARLDSQFSATTEDESIKLVLQNGNKNNALLHLQLNHQTTEYDLRLSSETPLISTVGTAITLDRGSSILAEVEMNKAKVGTALLSQPELRIVMGEDSFNFSSKLLLKADISKVTHSLAYDTMPQLKQATLELPVILGLDDENIYLTIEQNAVFKAQEINADFGSITNPHIQLPRQTIEISRTELLPRSVLLEISADKAEAENFRLSPVSMSVRLSQHDDRFQTELSNQQLAINLADANDDYHIPPYTLTALSETIAKGEGFSQLLDENASIDIKLLNQCGETLSTGSLKGFRHLQLNSQRTFYGHNSLANWLDMKFANDIVSGNADLGLKWDMESASGPIIGFRLNNAYAEGTLGSFDDIQLSFSNIDAKLADEFTLKLGIKTLNMGTDISDLEADLKLVAGAETRALAIHSFTASVFDGKISTENQHWQQGQDAEITVDIEGIDLAQIVQSQGIEGLNINGSLSGHQPVSISADGEFSLSKGTLLNTRDGVISYTSVLSDDASLNAQLKLTLDVLKNFHYHKLETETGYADSNLMLRSKISGTNPDIPGGQEIELNLNTEVPLLSSIQLMRLRAGLEAYFEKTFDRTAGSENTAFCKNSY